MSSFLARVRVVGGEALGLGLDRRIRDPRREDPAQADRVGGRGVAVLAELRDVVAVDRHADRLAQRHEAVRVLRVVEHQRDRVRRRGVEGVVVRRVLGLVGGLDVRHEVVRPVDLAALDLQQRGVVRGRLLVLEARDLRRARLPVGRVLAVDDVLRRQPRDVRERARADRLGVLERRGLGLTFDQMCCGTTNWRFRLAAMNCESGVLSVIATRVRGRPA